MDRWSPDRGRGDRDRDRSDNEDGDDRGRYRRGRRDSERNRRDEDEDEDDLGRRRRRSSPYTSRSYDRRRGHTTPERGGRDRYRERDDDRDDFGRRRYRSRSPISGYDREERRGRDRERGRGRGDYDRSPRGGAWPRGESRDRSSRGPTRELPQRDERARINRPPNAPTSGPMSFRQFMSQLSEDVDEKSATDQYAAYKVKFLQTQIFTFFEAHKNSEWFIDEYLPERANALLEVRNEVSRRRANILLEKEMKLDADEGTGGTHATKSLCSDLRMTEDDPEKVVKFISDLNYEYELAVSETALEAFNKGEAEKERENEEYDNDNVDSTKKNIMDEDMLSGDELMQDKKDDTDDEKEKEDDEFNFRNDADSDGGLDQEQHTPAKVAPKLFVKNLSVQISRQDLMDVCSAAGPVIRLSFSNVMPNKRCTRMAWVTYAVGADVKKIINSLDGVNIKGCKLSFVMNNAPNVKIKVAPVQASERVRLLIDLEQTKKTIETLDKRAGLFMADNDDEVVTQNPFINTIEPPSRSTSPVRMSKVTNKSDKGKNEKKVRSKKVSEKCKNRDIIGDDIDISDRTHTDESDVEDDTDSEDNRGRDDCEMREDGFSVHAALDKHLLYLRVVHNYCYYSGVVAKDVDELIRRCGHLHVRPRSSTNEGDHVRERQNSTIVRDGGGGVEDYERWAKRVDDRVRLVLNPFLSDQDADTLIKTNPNEKTNSSEGEEDEANKSEDIGYQCDKEVQRFITSSWTQIETEKFKCLLCSKMFRGQEFVIKHLKKKHSEELQSVRDKVMMFRQYVRDADRITSDSLQVMSTFSGGGRFSEHRPFLPRGPMNHILHDGPPRSMIPHGRPPFMNGPPPGHVTHRPPPQHMMFRGGPMGPGPNGPLVGPHDQGFHPLGPQLFHPRMGMERPMRPPGPIDPRAERGLRQYTDLDAPPSDKRGPDFRELVNYGDI
eukprot:CFRG2630T1